MKPAIHRSPLVLPPHVSFGCVGEGRWWGACCVPYHISVNTCSGVRSKWMWAQHCIRVQLYPLEQFWYGHIHVCRAVGSWRSPESSFSLCLESKKFRSPVHDVGISGPFLGPPWVHMSSRDARGKWVRISASYSFGSVRAAPTSHGNGILPNSDAAFLGGPQPSQVEEVAGRS